MDFRCALSLPKSLLCSFALVFFGTVSLVHAEEPNETFAERTILDPGVLTVSDDLFPGEGSFPDTLLGAFDSFGTEVAFNDDDSPFGNGFASAISNVPVDLSTNGIDFTVTGFGDDFFEGFHDEFGDYEAIVDVFDLNGGFIESFSVFGTLEPGFADNYTFDDEAWLGGSYDVLIDNTIGGAIGGDVDFFTFTGLTPGSMFTAETVSAGEIDTIMAWFDDLGSELDFNDDFNGLNLLSQLQGTVPASGELTFAVSGFGDDFFEGTHLEQDFYDLQLTIDGAALPGDFDGDGDVDDADLTNPAVGWQARYGNDLIGEDFLTWQQQFGAGTLAAVTAVPEPTAIVLILLGSCLVGIRPRPRKYC